MDKLSEQEKEFVRAWIDEDEQSSKHFEELYHAWYLLREVDNSDTTDVGQEWQHFKRNLLTPHLKVVLQLNNSGDERFSHDESRAGKSKLIRIVTTAAVAASVLLVIIARDRSFFNTGSTARIPVKIKEGGKANVALITRRETNQSSKPKKIALEDGSEIVLYGNSEVSFQEGFPGNRREIKLSGKADFIVAKERTKPFTVYSGEIATTAVGTKFTVTAHVKSDRIVVRLYEGKVVVKSSSESKKKLTGSYWLIPGKELVYHKTRANATIRSFRIITQARSRAKADQRMIANDQPFPLDKPGTWFMFNNQSLSQVLNQLALMFDRKIIYSRKDVQKIYFVGKFDKSGDLNSILEQIAALNGLKLTRKGDAFVLRKGE